MPGRQIVFLFFVVQAQVASAEMFTWTDPQGITHFSDQPPRGQPTQPVLLRKPSIVPMSENLKASEKVQLIRREVERTLVSDAPNNARRASKAADARQQTCEKLRQQLERVQQQLRSGYSNGQGNRLRAQRRKFSQRHSRECVLG